MPVQAQHRFSVRDYYRMAEAGVLSPDARVELLDGKIIDMSPIGPFHGDVTTYLTEFFAAASKGRWRTRVQNPVWLDEHSEPQPDLVLAKPMAGVYRQRHPRAEEVYLLIEIADTSLETDQTDKLPAYGRAGIAEVWIVNLNELTVEVYREPNFTGYGRKTILRAGDQARPAAFPDAAVDVADLLKR
jgi:Uma2 family endonuclease